MLLKKFIAKHNPVIVSLFSKPIEEHNSSRCYTVSVSPLPAFLFVASRIFGVAVVAPQPSTGTPFVF